MSTKLVLAVALAVAAAPSLAAPVAPAGTPAVRPAQALATPVYSLSALRALARDGHPALAAAAAQVDASRAQVIGAGAYPNPEVEFLAGRTQARVPGAVAGGAQNLSVQQRLDNPWQREARIAAAQSGLEARLEDRMSFV